MASPSKVGEKLELYNTVRNSPTKRKSDLDHLESDISGEIADENNNYKNMEASMTSIGTSPLVANVDHLGTTKR